MPRSIWNGVITFGMVSIPIKLYTATENKDIAFHQLHEKCDTRVKYQKFCQHCERTIENDEIEKGYEYARGQYVILTDEDFEQLPLPSKHAIEVSAFVEMAQIDPIYYEKSYYVEPDEAATRPFGLFMKAITDMEMVAIASITLRNKERLCALRPLGGTLVLDTLLYPDEVRVDADTEAPDVKVSEKELKMAEHLIELMKQDFDPAAYHDHYRDALKKVIEAKLEGKEIVEAPESAPRAKVVDLMEALRNSVETLQGKAGGVKAADKRVKAQIAKSTSAAEDEDEDQTAAKPKRSRKTAAHESKAKRTGTTRRGKKSA
jgi:DNA end-binding protein Ku